MKRKWIALILALVMASSTTVTYASDETKSEKIESVKQLEENETDIYDEEIVDKNTENIVTLGEKYYVRDFNGVRSYFLNPVRDKNTISTLSVRASKVL